MKTLTFRDFTFRAQHSMEGHSEAASHPHWHTYTVRFWFSRSPDQDSISSLIEKKFQNLHGSLLNSIMGHTSDEDLAAWFLKNVEIEECDRVRVTNDGQRGAEVWK